MMEEGLHLYIPPDVAAAFINPVAGNTIGFNKRQLKGAKLAKELYAKLIYPSLKDFKWATQTNQVANCPVTVDDIDNCQKIYGKDVAALKWKTT